jgi:flagellar motor protein MotB
MRLRTVSFTVALAGLALAGCVTESTYKAEVAKATTFQQLNTQLQGELKADQAQIAQLDNIIRVTLKDALLFPEGGVQMNAAGKATLDRLAPVLKTLTGQKIEVKGFTDNVPIGPELRARFPTNEALSKARAEDVVAYLASQGVPRGIMVPQGFGAARPIASNDTTQGRAQNRRVELDIIQAK